jgi:hypothetical protein
MIILFVEKPVPTRRARPTRAGAEQCSHPLHRGHSLRDAPFKLAPMWRFVRRDSKFTRQDFCDLAQCSCDFGERKGIQPGKMMVSTVHMWVSTRFGRSRWYASARRIVCVLYSLHSLIRIPLKLREHGSVRAAAIICIQKNGN